MAGSGLFTTLGYAAEETWGTFAAPTSFLWSHKEDGEFKKNINQSKVLHGGLGDLAARRTMVSKEATQSFDLDLEDRNLAPLFKQMFGAASVTGSDSPYTMVFTPADLTGQSLSIQIGRPMTNNSTLQAISYEGCKVTDWTIAIKGAAIASFNVTFDSMQEDSTQDLTEASDVTDNVFPSCDAKLVLGGTVSTSDGVTSVSDGTTVSLNSAVSLKTAYSYNTKRFFLGSLTKEEQLEDDTRQYTGSATIEFNDLSTVYDSFIADDSTALQLTFEGPVISGSTHSSLVLLVPCIYWNEDKFPASGPQIIEQDTTFVGLDDGTDNQIQATYVTLDSTA